MNLRSFLLPLIFCFSMNSITYADNNNMSEQQIITQMNDIIKQLDLGNSLSAHEFINNNKDYNFTNLYLTTDSIEITVSNHPGKLTTNNGSINLITTDPGSVHI